LRGEDRNDRDGPAECSDPGERVNKIRIRSEDGGELVDDHDDPGPVRGRMPQDPAGPAELGGPVLDELDEPGEERPDVGRSGCDSGRTAVDRTEIRSALAVDDDEDRRGIGDEAAGDRAERPGLTGAR
jgi:hypothetical protein